MCRGRYGLGGLVLHFILGSNLGGVGPERCLPGEGEIWHCNYVELIDTIFTDVEGVD